MYKNSSSNRKTVLVMGATASLAQPLCRELARRGYGVTLCGRDERELELRAGDLHTRYGLTCRMVSVDMLEPTFSATRFIEQAGAFDILIFAAGDMGTAEQDDLENLVHLARVNYVVPMQILSVAAETLQERGGGSMVVIGSVAGDRGRASNYEYGAPKAALAAFASGLRNRYASKGVHIMTVKPGFMDTPMTWGMHSPLIATRERVAGALVDALEAQRDVVYLPWLWRWIMAIVCHIPERVFKRLSF